MKRRFSFIFLFCLALTSTCFSQNKNYWQQHVNYKMNIDVDVSHHQFTGTQKVIYTNNSPDTLNRIFYHLYFNAFQPGSMMDVRSRTIVDPDSRIGDRILHLPDDEIGYQHIQKLTQDGQPVDFKMDGTILEVTLNKPIAPNTKSTFKMNFDAQVPRQIRRSGWMNKEGVEFSMSQWYPKISEYDEDGWHPNPYVAREFYGVFGSFDVTIHIDSSYVMAATGYLQNPQQIGYNYQKEGTEVHHHYRKLSWHWKADNVHDFMWAADPNFIHIKKKVPNGPVLHFFYQQDTVAVNASQYSQQELTDSWEKLPKYIIKAFGFNNKHYGIYPYDKFSVIQGGDGGMEYPMATLVTGNRSFGSLVGTTVHELTHNWFYGVLATNESRFPWMDEGFTTYASTLNMDQLFNPKKKNPFKGSYHSYFALHKSGHFETLDTHADHYATNTGYEVAAYSAGAIFLNQLRYIIGNKAFNSGMKRYFGTWKFKHPDGRDFLRVMEKESNMILDWYYQYFIESTKTVDYGIKSVQKEGDSGSTTITLERNDLTPMPIDLMATYNDGSKQLFYIPLRIMRGEKPTGDYPGVARMTEADWPWVNPTYSLQIAKPKSSIKQIEIDPSQRMADIDRSNNVFEVQTQVTDSAITQ